MAAKRETKTQKRHEDIYKEYLKVYAEESARHGCEFMERLDKFYIYERVAEALGWSSIHVYHVVNKMLKRQTA